MENFNVLKNPKCALFEGCDFVVQLPEDRREDVRILQLTDMQIIDATQRRRPERLRADELEAWDPANFDIQCGNHIRSLVAQARPDLIIITGDIVYGSFDDSGESLKWMCNLMDSFKIPWAPVFGNHDNESKMGVKWQCELLESREYCLFKRGTVSGNGNYTVGIAMGEELVRVIHMLDSNGCTDTSDPSVIRVRGIYEDQLDLVRNNTALIRKAQKRDVPAFTAFHIPVDSFVEAEMKKGYRRTADDTYILGVDVEPKDKDFGFALEKYIPITSKVRYIDFFKEVGIDGVFVGHAHSITFSISYEDIVWTFGLKTGQYDYHIPYQLGGTLITLSGEDFDVKYLPSLVSPAIMPGRAPMFKGLLAE